MLRRLLRTCRGGAAGNRTLTPSELAQLAQEEIDLASGKTSALTTGAGAGTGAATAGSGATAAGAGAAAGVGATQESAAGTGSTGTGTAAAQDQGAAQKQGVGGTGGRKLLSGSA